MRPGKVHLHVPARLDREVLCYDGYDAMLVSKHRPRGGVTYIYEDICNDACIYDDACTYGDARVERNARGPCARVRVRVRVRVRARACACARACAACACACAHACA